MSTQEKPPREWKLTDGLISWSHGSVHVIEYSAYESLHRENQRLHLQWSAAMNARDEARAALETWETRWRNCNDRAKEAYEERDALKQENERLKRERHDVKCPHCLQSFWFTAWDGEYPHNLSIPCSHLKERDAALAEVERLTAIISLNTVWKCDHDKLTIERDELKARLAEAERLLDTIKDAPIWVVQKQLAEAIAALEVYARDFTSGKRARETIAKLKPEVGG